MFTMVYEGSGGAVHTATGNRVEYGSQYTVLYQSNGGEVATPPWRVISIEKKASV